VKIPSAQRIALAKVASFVVLSCFVCRAPPKTLSSFPAFKQNSEAHTMFSCSAERNYWLQMLQMAYEGQIDTWDFQWTFAVWLNRGLCVLPNVNLVSNIGFWR
jgi:hypothetical protein